MSHLICTVAFVGDRDHYGASTEKKHITAGQVAEGTETRRRGGRGREGLAGSEGAAGGEGPPLPAARLSAWSPARWPPGRCSLRSGVCRKDTPVRAGRGRCPGRPSPPLRSRLVLRAHGGWAAQPATRSARSQALPLNRTPWFGQTVQQGNGNNLLFVLFALQSLQLIVS